MNGDNFATFLGILTFLVGIAGAIRAGTRLTRRDLAQTVELQHTLWEETRAELEDCREELRRTRDKK